MFVNLRDAPICGKNRDESICLEGVSDLLTKEGILSELCCDDHPRPRKQFIGRLCPSCIGIRKLFSIQERVQLLLLDKMCVVVRDEVLDDFIRSDTKTLREGEP